VQRCLAEKNKQNKAAKKKKWNRVLINPFRSKSNKIITPKIHYQSKEIELK